MPELNENRVREIVCDEIAILHITDRLVVIDAKLNQKADKTDIEKLHQKKIKTSENFN